MHSNNDCPVIIMQGIIVKQEKWAYTSIESIEETEQEITVDAQRHSNSPRNPFEKHFWMRMYRNCIYGALTIYILTARLHICPSSLAGLMETDKTFVGSNSTISIVPTPHPW